MTRTTRYKIQYAVLLVPGLMLGGVAGWALGGRPLIFFLLCAVLLIPGRLTGFFLRDLLRGHRLKNAGELEASLESFQSFATLLAARPRLRHLWWLNLAVYTRDLRAMTLNNIGAVQLDLGRFDQAEATFREALTVDPEYPIPHFNLAVLSKVRGDAVKVDEHTNLAITLGYSRNVTDRVLHAASALFARIEGRGPGAKV